MANIKSQIKRNKQNEKRRLRNRVYRGSARVAVRNAFQSIDSANSEESGQAVLAAISALDVAAQKGVIHMNNAARRKGRLMKRLSAIGVQAVKPAKEAKPKAVEAEVVEEATPKKKPAAVKTTKKPAAAKTKKKPAATKTTKKPAATKTAKKTTTSKTTKKTTKK